MNVFGTTSLDEKTSVSITVRQIVKNWVFEYGSIKSLIPRVWLKRFISMIQQVYRVESDTVKQWYSESGCYKLTQSLVSDFMSLHVRS